MGQQQTAGLVLQFMIEISGFLKLLLDFVTARGDFIGERTQTTPALALARGVPNMGHASEIQADENPPPVNDNDNGDNNRTNEEDSGNEDSEDEESGDEDSEDEESEDESGDGEGDDGESEVERGYEESEDDIEMLIRRMEESDAEREVRGFPRVI